MALTFNLLKQYIPCRVLIHRRPEAHNTGIDPYKEEEEDPQKSDAIESSLWELEDLREHEIEEVRDMADIFFSPPPEKLPRKLFDMEEYSELLSPDEGILYNTIRSLSFHVFFQLKMICRMIIYKLLGRFLFML